MKIKVIGKKHSTGTFQCYDYDNTMVYGTSLMPYDVSTKGEEKYGYISVAIKVRKRICPWDSIHIGDEYEFDTNKYDDVVLFRKLE